MRAIRWSIALILSLSLLSPPVSLAQGRGQGDGAKAKVEKVEKRRGKDDEKQGKKNRGKPAQAQKQAQKKKAQKQAVRPHAARARGQQAERLRERGREERTEVRRQRPNQRLRKARQARAEVREHPREERRARRQERREAPRDRPVSARVIEELRREDRRPRIEERRQREDRRFRARIEERRRYRESDRFPRDFGPDRRTRAAERPMRFRGLDGNGDGRISRREWRGNDVSFRNHDWNGDGVLAGAEVVPGGQRQRLDRAAPAERFRRTDRVGRLARERPILRIDNDDFGRRLTLPPRPLVTRLDRALVVNQRLWADPSPPRRYFAQRRDGVAVIDFGLDLDDELGLFTLPLTLLLTDALVDDVDLVVRTERWADFDRDFDGFVTSAEWPAGTRTFRRFDRDDDLVLVREELFFDDGLVAVDRDRFLLFEALDRDGDGLVAPWEWPGSLDSFFFRDFNADGAISLDELVGLDADLEVRRMGFDTLDFDRDGEIARVEWVGDPVRFARLDRNDNGVVGRWEFGLGWLFAV